MTTRHRPDLSTRIVCDFWLVATMATMATPRGRPLKKICAGVLLGVYHPTSSPLYLFFKIQFRGGHGGHGGHAPRVHGERLSADETAGRAVMVASGVPIRPIAYVQVQL